MTADDRAQKKQLLLMKGEILRVKLRLEMRHLRQHPLSLASSGVKTWFSNRVFTLLSEWLPEDNRSQRWLKTTARAFSLWQVIRRLWTDKHW